MANSPQPDPAQQLRAEYRATFGGPHGKIVLEDLRKKYGDRQSHTPGDTHETAFKEGQRSVYTMIRLMLAEDPSFEEATR